MTVTNPAPKPTSYNGVPMRSDLETKYAGFAERNGLVFGIGFRYEPARWSTKDGWWNPDFVHTSGWPVSAPLMRKTTVNDDRVEPKQYFDHIDLVDCVTQSRHLWAVDVKSHLPVSVDAIADDLRKWWNVARRNIPDDHTYLTVSWATPWRYDSSTRRHTEVIHLGVMGHREYDPAGRTPPASDVCAIWFGARAIDGEKSRWDLGAPCHSGDAGALPAGAARRWHCGPDNALVAAHG